MENTVKQLAINILKYDRDYGNDRPIMEVVEEIKADIGQEFRELIKWETGNEKVHD